MPFDDIVLGILSSVDVIDASVGLLEPEFEAAFESLRTIEGAGAERLAEQLLIVLGRYQDALGLERTKTLTVQICVLVAAVVRNTDRVRALFAAQGIRADDALRRAADFLDQRGSMNPVKGDISASSSVFNTFVRSKGEQKR
jgi:hypothetical protein